MCLILFTSDCAGEASYLCVTNCCELLSSKLSYPMLEPKKKSCQQRCTCRERERERESMREGGGKEIYYFFNQ